MSSYKNLILASCLILTAGCGCNDKEQEVGKPPPEATAQPHIDVEEEFTEEPYEYDGTGSSLPSLADIRQVIIVTLSDNPRDGFRAEIIYNESGESQGQNYLYDWKLNGEDISGEIGEELKWRDGFKKGDTITVSVTPYNDLGQGTRSAEGGFRIPNSPPRILSVPEAQFEDGRFSYSIQAEDPDGDPIDFTLRNSPRGMTIEPATGLIVWDYGEQDAGTYTVTIVVSDSEGAKASQDLTLSIDPAENPFQ